MDPSFNLFKSSIYIYVQSICNDNEHGWWCLNTSDCWETVWTLVLNECPPRVLNEPRTNMRHLAEKQSIHSDRSSCLVRQKELLTIYTKSLSKPDEEGPQTYTAGPRPTHLNCQGPLIHSFPSLNLYYTITGHGWIQRWGNVDMEGRL